MLDKLRKFQKFSLATYPTPLEPAPRLSEELGIELMFRRDDAVELALGGNKVRKLEYLIGDALSKGYDTVITTGATYSNHARLTAAAAVKAGLIAYLVLTPTGGKELKVNLLLDKLLGAEVVFTDSDPREGDGETRRGAEGEGPQALRHTCWWRFAGRRAWVC